MLAGAEAKFVDQLQTAAITGYYVTAVDVAGKESLPSRSSYTDGSTLDSLQFQVSIPMAIHFQGLRPLHQEQQLAERAQLLANRFQRMLLPRQLALKQRRRSFTRTDLESQ